MIERIKCDNCGAMYKVEHDLPEEDFIERFCPFCGDAIKEEMEDIIEDYEDEYE